MTGLRCWFLVPMRSSPAPATVTLPTPTHHTAIPFTYHNPLLRLFRGCAHNTAFISDQVGVVGSLAADARGLPLIPLR